VSGGKVSTIWLPCFWRGDRGIFHAFLGCFIWQESGIASRRIVPHRAGCHEIGSAFIKVGHSIRRSGVRQCWPPAYGSAENGQPAGGIFVTWGQVFTREMLVISAGHADRMIVGYVY